jgi:hypothetical protein
MYGQSAHLGLSLRFPPALLYQDVLVEFSKTDKEKFKYFQDKQTCRHSSLRQEYKNKLLLL